MPPSSRSATTEALERKVRAVYEAIDSNNYKNALKLCDGLLDKYPESHLVMSLKSLTLQRLGRIPEAMKICDRMMASLPIDESAAHIMKMTLKALKRLPDITRMHEAAVEADPGDLDALESLFAAYAREGKFLQQQQIAMKLLKASGGQERYQWWIVLTLMLQVRAAVSQSAGAATDQAMKLLQLAESMTARQAKTNKLEGFEALLLYLDLLLARGKPQEALAVLQGPVGASVVVQEDERGALLADLLAQCGDRAGAAKVLRDRLGRNPDDWTALQRYLDCQLPDTSNNTLLQTSTLLRFDGSLAACMTSASPASPQQPGPDLAAAAADCQQLIDHMLSQATSGAGGTGGLMRGPYLAKVELSWRQYQLAQRQSQPPATMEPAAQAFAQAVLSYWQVAGHLVSCAADLRSYLPELPQQQASWLWQELGGDGLVSGPAAGGWDQGSLRRRVSALQLCADMQQPPLTSDTAAVAYAQQLMQLYTSALPLYEGLDERERGPADELPCLAVGAIMQAACAADTTPSAIRLCLTSLLTLEAAVVTRPYASAMRLALTALHTLFAAAPQAAKHMSALDIKNIQLDTLASHHLLPCLLSGPAPVEGRPGDKEAPGVKYGLARLLKDTHAMYSEHQRDAGDTLDLAYRHGMYSKVLEFVAFKQRLDDCHTLAVTRVEAATTSLRSAAVQCSAGSSLSQALGTALLTALQRVAMPWEERPPRPAQGALRFNEDLATRPGWYPPQHSPAPLHAASWWARRQQAAPSARSSTAWWMRPAAAEATTPEAQAWRDKLMCAVHVRWCHVHVLTRVLAQLQACELPVDVGVVPEPDQALTDCAACLGCTDAGQVDDWLQQQAGGAMSTDATHPSLELVTTSVLASGVAVAQACMSASGAPDAPADAVLTTRLNTTQGMLSQVVTCICAELQSVSDSRLPIPGSLLLLPSLLLSESLVWFSAVLEAASGLHKASRKGRKSSDATGPAWHHVITSVETTATSCVELLQQLGVALGCVRKSLDEQLSASQLESVFEQGLPDGVSALWAWQPGAYTALGSLAQEQQSLVSGMIALSSSLQHRLAKLCAPKA